VFRKRITCALVSRWVDHFKEGDDAYNIDAFFHIIVQLGVYLEWSTWEELKRDHLTIVAAPVVVPVVAEALFVEALIAPIAENLVVPAAEALVAPVVAPMVAPVVEARVAPVAEALVAPVVEALDAPVVEALVAPVVEALVAPVVQARVAPVVEVLVAPVVEALYAPVSEALVAPVAEALVAPAAEAEALVLASDAEASLALSIAKLQRKLARKTATIKTLRICNSRLAKRLTSKNVKEAAATAVAKATKWFKGKGTRYLTDYGAYQMAAKSVAGNVSNKSMGMASGVDTSGNTIIRYKVNYVHFGLG
jgi:hypothetical protein